MAEDTRTTLHITTTSEILINMQTLHLNMLRCMINGFYQLLSGNLSPDLIDFAKMAEIYEKMQTKAETKGLSLIAKNPRTYITNH